jgi:hypothetical protein
MISKLYLIALAICLAIGGFIGYSIKPDKDCPEPTTTIEFVDVPVKHDSLIYVPKVIPKLQKVNVDSIYFAAKKYWQQFYDNDVPVDFVAQTDTVFNDSLLQGSIAFVSRIPLDPIGYFKTDLTVRERIITNTIIQTEDVGFWYKRFIAYMGAGINYDGKTVAPGLQIGFGIRIN